LWGYPKSVEKGVHKASVRLEVYRKISPSRIIPCMP
jgi:hypothetical protein